MTENRMQLLIEFGRNCFAKTDCVFVASAMGMMCFCSDYRYRQQQFDEWKRMRERKSNYPNPN